ncbi:phosphoribosyltransferase family protein [Nocardioides sp. C4-1]|uniref:ComF family protein n=1 Tax=Nocardioides sp. C4-1 TaxID=3151851 RepID=UPI00326568AC
MGGGDGSLGDAAADLLLGGTCLGCARPGRLLCPPCEAALPTTPFPVAGSAAWAAASYESVVRALVVGHKERRLLALTPVLGALLARAVAAALDDARVPPGDAVLLVPVPSRPSAVRSRGHDPTLAMLRVAARSLGGGVRAQPLLRTRVGVVDQSGLDVSARRANLAGSMAVSARALRRAARGVGAVHVVVCDDVVTTGSTLAEARRALAAVGVTAVAAATVAATPLRHRAVHSDSSDPEVPWVDRTD